MVPMTVKLRSYLPLDFVDLVGEFRVFSDSSMKSCDFSNEKTVKFSNFESLCARTVSCLQVLVSPYLEEVTRLSKKHNSVLVFLADQAIY